MMQEGYDQGCEALVLKLADEDHQLDVIRTAIEKGWTAPFVDSLDRFIEKNESDIRAVCNENYAEFISSVREVLKMREEVAVLKDKLRQLNARVQETGGSALKTSITLEEKRQLRTGISEGIDAMKRCLQLVDLANDVKAQLDACSYYDALKASSRLSQELSREQLQEGRVVHEQEIEEEEAGRVAVVKAPGLPMGHSQHQFSGRGVEKSEHSQQVSLLVSRLVAWIPEVQKLIRTVVTEGCVDWLVEMRRVT